MRPEDPWVFRSHTCSNTPLRHDLDCASEEPPTTAQASPTTAREFELKLRVSDAFRLPDLVAGVPYVAGAEAQPVRNLTAEYYDTADFRLFRSGVTLRRREGGNDAGWHLKLPANGGARDEIHLPLSAGAAGRIPDALFDIVTALRREAPLRLVATLQTQRRPLLLNRADGKSFAELVDDAVSILDHGQLQAAFREVEIEALLPEMADQLQAVAAYLIQHGAVVEHRQKVETALGAGAFKQPDVMRLPWPRPQNPAGSALRAHLAKHVYRLLQEDGRMRRDLPDAVHQMRVAARQLRSGLKVFVPMVDRQWARQLHTEIGWIASELGAIRDTEVLLQLLTDHATALPPEQSRLARQAIDEALQPRLASARAEALTGLRTQRYQDLLESLVTAVNDPRLTDQARQPCEKILPPLVEHSWRSLKKRVRQLGPESSAPDWHRARIAAKKTRYAAEIMAPIFGERTKAFARSLACVTDVLGDQHDATIAQQALAAFADAVNLDGPSGDALDLLSANEQDGELQLRKDFWSIWPTVVKAHRLLP